MRVERIFFETKAQTFGDIARLASGKASAHLNEVRPERTCPALIPSGFDKRFLFLLNQRSGCNYHRMKNRSKILA